MAVVRWDPWTELASLQRDVQELFGRTAAPSARRAGALAPPMDAFDNGEALVLRLELPGIAPDQVDVNFDHGVLTVSGERRDSEDVAEDRWLRRERAVGSFSRSVTLPEGVDPAKIRANFSNGLLELHVPHSPQQRPHRIPVQSADDVDVTEQSAAADARSSG